MCTLSFVPLQAGFALAMNRDEQKTRPRANSPAIHQVGERLALYPSEPTGGTWFGATSEGIALALLNWYEKTATPLSSSPPLNKVSRGGIVPRLFEFCTLGEMDFQLNEAAFLANRQPFRLLGFQAEEGQNPSVGNGTIFEWKWDEKTLVRLAHPWKTQHWFSSGHDEPGANRIRGEIATQANLGPGSDIPKALRKLHASHLPERGPYSICMHREDAQTVSFVELLMQGKEPQMTYCDGPPCGS